MLLLKGWQDVPKYSAALGHAANMFVDNANVSVSLELNKYSFGIFLPEDGVVSHCLNSVLLDVKLIVKEVTDGLENGIK